MRKRLLTPLITLIVLSTTTSPALASETPQERRRCDKAIELAKKVGWRNKDLPYLRYVLHRESRCQHDSIGRNRDKTGRITSQDWGYAQINDVSWLRYLRDKGLIDEKEDLLNPRINLKAALLLAEYSEDRGLPRFYQWRKGNSAPPTKRNTTSNTCSASQSTTTTGCSKNKTTAAPPADKKKPV